VATPAHEAVHALARHAAAIAQGRNDRAVRDGARAALSRYVQELKADDVAPERALITVKVVARSLSSDVGVRARQALVDEIVRWFVDAYYRTPSVNDDRPRPAGA
jgi:hypothetical protein